jgi:amino acid adenylation domain-containing protein
MDHNAPGLLELGLTHSETAARHQAMARTAWRPGSPSPTTLQGSATPTTAQEEETLERESVALCLHELFEAQVALTPAAPAVYWGKRQLTYEALDRQANRLAGRLKALGVEPGARVAVCAERSGEMVVGLLAVLKAGAAYVPLDPSYPIERLAFMVEDAQVQVVLTQQKLLDRLPRLSAPCVCLDAIDLSAAVAPTATCPKVHVKADQLAYLIYTSGSTGQPKGVMISHRSAVNTICDINIRFRIGVGDRVLALSSVGFDLSVYDIFGLLAVGGAVVLPEQEAITEPRRWVELIERHQITVWNSVPAFLEMLVVCAKEVEAAQLESLTCVLLSGDWIPVSLPDRIRTLVPKARVVSLGGATEAAIWSIYFPIEQVDPVWKSIPYGRPLSNQSVVVLDEALRPCPVGVAGQIHIGGDGVALGYWNRPELTAERFIPDPMSEWPLARTYRTGDLGRVLPDGNIEFLGRMDDQVKIRGYRIELGEIETNLVRHPAVAQAAVVARRSDTGHQYLAAYVVPKPGAAPLSEDLRSFLRQTLPEYMVPPSFTSLDALILSPNGKVNRRALPPPTYDPTSASRGHVAPRDAIELELAKIWEYGFDVRPIGIQDNFFDLGGDSLMAAALMAHIEDELGQALPLAVLHQCPTIEQLAGLLREQRFALPGSSLVVLQVGATRPALFCVPGIHGSLWEFGKLGALLGPEWQVFGLQPVGLDGRTAPHSTIAEMAAHYIGEMRQVQPKGPYRLAGFSLGGAVAFEMARQLSDAGETVNFLALLDAPARGLPKLMRCCQRACDKIGRRLKRQPRPDTSPAMATLLESHHRALDNYRPQSYPGQVTVFVSSIRPSWPKRWLDNSCVHWILLAELGGEAHIVPGDHDGIFKPGNIEVLADKFKASLLASCRDTAGQKFE